VLLEGYRPGVLEGLGFAPEALQQRCPRLVLGRMTGWGQAGPLAAAAGHDLTYAALAGVLHAIGPAERPVPPLNLVADYGGGAMLLAFGVLAALFERQRSGHGQVVDAAMVDGAALLGTLFHGLAAAGAWSAQRADNLLDGGAPFYDCYACADGRHLAVAALEPRFFANLLRGLDLPAEWAARQHDRAAWPALRATLAAALRTRPRDDWCALFDGQDACVAPVLDFAEAAAHPHAVARGAYVELDGVVQPAPAPRFSRSGHAPLQGAPRAGAHTRLGLAAAGFAPAEIDALFAAGVAAEARA
jgi:alpha-methylacyl-CoA racemase